MPFRLTILAAALMLAGCSDPVSEKPRKTRQERAAEAEVKLSQTPASRTYQIAGNELRVVDVPVKGMVGHVEIQRCFVWRDLEFKTAALSCPQPPEILLPD